MATATTRFSGRAFSVREMTLIREIVRDCSGLSRMELARTVCELLRWRRPNGRLKARECREFLERLDADGALVLPDKRRGRDVGSVTRVPRTAAGEPGRPLVGSVRDVEPLAVELVREAAQRLLFRELVGRYHDLGHTVPFGAHCAIWCSRRDLGGRWSAACSSPVRRGAWRRGTVGWVGTRRLGRAISSTWSTTAASCCCRGWRSRTSPARCSRAASGRWRRTGRATTASSRGSSRRWSTRAATTAVRIGPPTGWRWAPPAAAGAWTGTLEAHGDGGRRLRGRAVRAERGGIPAG